jgi:hypothetical protein
MTFNLSLFIIMISIVTAISASIFSNSDPTRYFAPSAMASSGEDCVGTDVYFNTDGECVDVSDSGGGGGGGAIGGCPDGEMYILGQGCTGITTVTACPPGQISQGGQCVKENPFGDPECTQGYNCRGDPLGPDKNENPDPTSEGKGDPLKLLNPDCNPDLQSCGYTPNPAESIPCERMPTAAEIRQCLKEICQPKFVKDMLTCIKGGALLPPAGMACAGLVDYQKDECIVECSLAKPSTCWKTE